MTPTTNAENIATHRQLPISRSVRTVARTRA